jgi:hypothetical protein
MIVCGIDANGLLTDCSKTITVVIPAGTNTNTVGTGTIFWAPGTVGYILFVGGDIFHCTFQQTDASHTPSSITITALTNELAFGPPDRAFHKFLVQVKREIHAGILGTTVASVAPNTIVLAGATITNNLAGATISVLGSAGSGTTPQKILDFAISSNSGNTLTLAVDPSPYVNVGDIVVVRSLASVVTANTIGCADFVNAITNSGLGLGTDSAVGFKVLIWSGPGIGQERRIIGNNATVLTLDQPWDANAMPVAGQSIFIVVDSTWRYSSDTDAMNVSNPNPTNPQTVVGVNVSNYLNQQLLVQVLSEDSTGTLGTSGIAAGRREVWIFGNQGNIPAPGNPIIFASTP